jgi:hypothetical protein
MDVSRRSVLSAIVACPAVVSVGSLMPLRGVRHDPIIRVQTWPFDTEVSGPWWAHEAPMSQISLAAQGMAESGHKTYWRPVKSVAREMPGRTLPDDQIVGDTYICGSEAVSITNGGRMGYALTREEKDAFSRQAKEAPHRAYNQSFSDWKAYDNFTEALIKQRSSVCRWGA